MNKPHRVRHYSELIEDPLYKEYALPKIQDVKHYAVQDRFNARIRRLLAAADKAAAEQDWDEEQKSDELSQAIGILISMRYALNSNQEPTQPAEKLEWELDQRELWWHRDEHKALMEGKNSRHSHHIDKELLLEEVEKYLKRPWMQDNVLDWLLCDALVFHEAYAVCFLLKEELFNGRVGDNIERLFKGAKWDGSLTGIPDYSIKQQWTPLLNTLLLYVGLPLMPFLALRWFDHYAIADLIAVLACAGLTLDFTLNRVLSRYLPNRSHSESTEKLRVMWTESSAAYRSLIRSPLNPGHVKSTLLAASQKGMVWDGAVFAILERAIQQDPVLWDCREE